jgi:hypothetical protein
MADNVSSEGMKRWLPDPYRAPGTRSDAYGVTENFRA